MLKIVYRLLMDKNYSFNIVSEGGVYMATIALYTDKIKEMPGLIKDIKQCVIDYKSELSALKVKTLKVNKFRRHP